MDPNAALREIKVILARYMSTGGVAMTPHDCARFFDLVEGLDRWLTNEGFMPDAWLKNRP